MPIGSDGKVDVALFKLVAEEVVNQLKLNDLIAGVDKTSTV